MWDHYGPQKLELVAVDSMARNRKDLGRVVVYDATGAEQPFEMSEAFYQVVSERIQKPKYRMPTGGMTLIVG